MLMKLPALLFLFTMVQLAGCTVIKEHRATARSLPVQAAPLDLIALDFASVLEQLPGLPPAATTVDMQHSARQDAFTLAMRDALQHVGYGIRWVHSDGSAFLFHYRHVAQTAAASARRNTYELAVGTIELRREYVSDGQRVRPVTPLLVRGADARGLIPADNIFDQQTSSSVAPAVVTRADSPEPVSLPELDNVFELGASNFADRLAGGVVVAEQILVFDNDSLRLGETNKQRISRMVQRFDPTTDVFSVIGCSMGPTRVRGGNAALALGRAGRVVEALRFAGVDDARILDEGCWAGDGRLDELPRRGVVVTLNRQG